MTLKKFSLRQNERDLYTLMTIENTQIPFQQRRCKTYKNKILCIIINSQVLDTD